MTSPAGRPAEQSAALATVASDGPELDADPILRGLVALAVQLCAAAAGYLSLRRGERQHFVAVHGVELREMPAAQFMLGPDAAGLVERLATPADAGALAQACGVPGAQRLAALSLRIDRAGQTLPAWLCVIGRTPQALDGTQRQTLLDLGTLLQTRLDARAQSAQLPLAPFEALLRTSAAAALLCCPAGLIRAVNPAAQRLLGYDAEELLGRPVDSLHSQAELVMRAAPLREPRVAGLMLWRQLAMLADARDLQEWQMQRKDGTPLSLLLTVAELRDAAGRPQAYLGLGWDLSERGRFDQLKSEFISTVSHELRTPLTAITGALGLLRGGACGALGEAAQPMLEIAHKNSQRLGYLINDLLDMERLDSGRMQLNLHQHPLMALVEKAIEQAQGFAREHQVEFQLCERADTAEVRVDAERLQQVIVNFLSNAAKFSPRGARIEVRVSCRDGAARVEVLDRGAGIPEHFRNRIFQKFAQADSSDTRQQGGTGLGLTICKELIERMHGLIGFESTPGVGTRFHFQLPLLRPPARTPQLVGSATAPGAPLVLVVEDEPDIAQLIVLMLNRAGLAAEVAGTALAAVERLQEGGVAAMTLDLLLPDQSGLALMRHIRELPGFRQLPVVVVSAFIEDGRHSLSPELEPVDWIPKPIDEVRLIRALHSALQRPTPTDPP